jgi:hypothetical protein
VLADKELAKIDPPDEIRSAQIEATRIPGMATSPWIQDMINTFGAESAAVAVRVRGDYASESDDAVVPLALTMKATANWDDHVDAKTLPDRREVGCDPARFGDDETVNVGKRAKHALAAMFCRKLDNVEVAAKVLEYCTANMRPGERPVVRVDVGGLGAGVVDVLRRVTWIDLPLPRSLPQHARGALVVCPSLARARRHDARGPASRRRVAGCAVLAHDRHAGSDRVEG